jgi:tetratricopeptide (TPR) repeat protein
VLPHLVETMAELVAEPPLLLRPDQAAQHYEEAVAVAVEACAADTVDQRCYICLETVHPDTNEGLVRGCACRGGAGFAHVSCLARGAQVEVERDVQNRWKRWHTCRQCEQYYHGVVSCALGWACWKTYVGWPETDGLRYAAMMQLGNGLYDAKRDEEALSVRETELVMMRRLSDSEENVLVVQNNLANSYKALGRLDEALRVRHEVYSGNLRLDGEEHEQTLRAANNYAISLKDLKRFEEAKSLLRKTLPVARRVLGESHDLTLKMRKIYAQTLYRDPAATLDDLREAVNTLEELAPIARRVLGGAHPVVGDIDKSLRKARARGRARIFT